jgi:Ni/Co efflux regulator RcnB
MNKILIGAMALSLVGASVATAQPYGGGPGQQHGDQAGGGQHPGWGQDYGGGHQWKRGERMGYNDWGSANRVDYRQHHLRKPPRGYEWRESNGQYILGAVATGVITSIILNSGR